VAQLYNQSAADIAKSPMASCTAPDGYLGDVTYNPDPWHVLQYCNGLNWISVTGRNDGPIHWWKLNESAGASTAADSVGTATGTVNTGATFAGGQINNALSVTGAVTNRNVSVPAMTEITNRLQLTLSTWFKRNAVNGRVQVGQQTGGGADTLAIEVYSDGLVYLAVGDATTTNHYGTVASNDTNWHLATLVFDGTQSTDATRLKGYLDGVPQTLSIGGSPIPAKTTPNALTFYMGGVHSGSSDNGFVDMVSAATANAIW
jgi:Concanavalin A-like lectin/glucanases superfamily